MLLESKQTVVEYMSDALRVCQYCNASRTEVTPASEPTARSFSIDNQTVEYAALECDFVRICRKCRVSEQLKVVLPLETLVAVLVEDTIGLDELALRDEMEGQS